MLAEELDVMSPGHSPMGSLDRVIYSHAVVNYHAHDGWIIGNVIAMLVWICGILVFLIAQVPNMLSLLGLSCAVGLRGARRTSAAWGRLTRKQKLTLLCALLVLGVQVHGTGQSSRGSRHRACASLEVCRRRRRQLALKTKWKRAPGGKPPRHRTSRRGDQHFDQKGGVSSSYLFADWRKILQEDACEDTSVFCHDPWKGVRVGEAKKPAPLVLDPDKARLWDYGKRSKEKEEQAEVDALSVVTANGTCWNSLKLWIEECEAHVLCLQEHKLTKDQIAEASQWALKRGWKSVWGAAVTSDETGKPSGGVAILVRKELGVSRADIYLQKSHRKVAALVDFPGGKRVLVTAAYFKSGEGFKETNAELMRDLGLAASRWRGQFLIGADFNMTPTQLAATGAASRMQGTIVATKEGTCRNPVGSRTIDSSLSPTISRLASLTSKWRSCQGWPHTPLYGLTSTAA